MVKDVVKVYADLQLRALCKGKVLTQAQVYAPGSGADQEVTFGNGGVIEHVSPRRRQPERTWIKELIARPVGVWISVHYRAERRAAEITYRVNKTAGDISGIDRAAVVAGPER